MKMVNFQSGVVDADIFWSQCDDGSFIDPTDREQGSEKASYYS